MITVPPQIRENAVDKAPYAKVAQQCYARMMMAKGQLNLFSQKFTLNNGVEIICSYCWGKQDIWIKVPPVVVGTTRVETVEVYGFFCKPRTQDNNYLNQDDDIAVLLHFDGDKWVTNPSTVPVEKPTRFFYGNIDWKGPLNDRGEGNVLSWKGPPTRYFPLDHRTHYEGLTVWDEDVLTYEYGMPVEVPYYTCFGPNVYSKGNILVAMPQYGATPTKVLGAAYGLDGKLFVFAGVNYRGMPNPESTEEVVETGGFFTELLVLQQANVFSRIDYWPAARHAVPFFFNQSGTQAVTVMNGYRTIITISSEMIDGIKVYSAVDETVDTNSLSFTYNRVSSVNEVGTDVTLPDPWSYLDKSVYSYLANLTRYIETTTTHTITKNGTVVVAADYKGDTLVESKITLNANNVSVNVSKDGEYYDLLDDYPFDPPAPLVASSVGDAVYVVGQTPVGASGGCLPYTYTGGGPATVDPETGAITAISCTPGGPAVATVTVTDANGQSSTASFRTFVGGWVPGASVVFGVDLGFPGCTYADGNCTTNDWGYIGNIFSIGYQKIFMAADRQCTSGAYRGIGGDKCWIYGYSELIWECA